MIVWDPGVRDVVANCAAPAVFRMAVPIALVPSRNVTVPVGVAPVPMTVTVVVNVTRAPVLDGDPLVLSVMVAGSRTITLPARVTFCGLLGEFDVIVIVP